MKTKQSWDLAKIDGAWKSCATLMYDKYLISSWATEIKKISVLILNTLTGIGRQLKKPAVKAGETLKDLAPFYYQPLILKLPPKEIKMFLTFWNIGIVYQIVLC